MVLQNIPNVRKSNAHGILKIWNNLSSKIIENTSTIENKFTLAYFMCIKFYIFYYTIMKNYIVATVQ